jgi:hypothetical protein
MARLEIGSENPAVSLVLLLVVETMSSFLFFPSYREMEWNGEILVSKGSGWDLNGCVIYP